MENKSALYDAIEKLNDDEIVERIKSDYYNDEALIIAKEILVQRGLQVPTVEEGYIKPKITFRESHPIWYWTFVGAGITMFLRLIKHFLI